MKKIGIMTFHEALNYGAVLQAYGLQKFITENFDGVDVEIVDYSCPKLKADYRPIKLSINPHRWKRCLASFRNCGVTIKMKKNFESFCSCWLRLSKDKYSVETIKSSNDRYDVFITGSDQVWDPRCAGFDENYFLTFVTDSEKKCSYAASMDKMEIPASMENVYRLRLKGYRCVSCREEAAAEVINGVLENGNAEVHVDPTFLLTKAMWENVAAAPLFEKYLFIYPVGKSLEMVRYAKEIAHDRGLKIVYMDAEKGWADSEITFISGESPEVFLSLIKHADCVVTNAFHGSAFSVIYHKDFYVYCGADGKGNERVQNMFRKFGITDRVLCGSKKYYTQTDWELVEHNINIERMRAKEYLQKVIG